MSVSELDTAIVLTVSEAAKLAKVSPWTIRKGVKGGRLKARRIGSCVRITRAEFDRWLASDDSDTPDTRP